MTHSNTAVFLASLIVLFYASMTLAQRRAARILPAEAQEAAALERAFTARRHTPITTNAVAHLPRERMALASNLVEVARSRMAFDDRALLRDGHAPTNDATLIRSARWKIISVQSVTNSLH